MFMDAETALEQIVPAQPNLVLSDVALNGAMTGIDLAEAIAQYHPHIPVVLMSGHASTTERLERAMAKGFLFKVHAKPFSPATLLREIVVLLGGAAASA